MPTSVLIKSNPSYCSGPPFSLSTVLSVPSYRSLQSGPHFLPSPGPLLCLPKTARPFFVLPGYLFVPGSSRPSYPSILFSRSSLLKLRLCRETAHSMQSSARAAQYQVLPQQLRYSHNRCYYLLNRLAPLGHPIRHQGPGTPQFALLRCYGELR